MSSLFSRCSFLLVAFAIGCGAPSWDEVCKKGCDKVGSCNGATQGQILDCKNITCKTNLTDGCKNSDKILTCVNDCYDKNCNDFQACVDGCEQCVR